MSEASTVFDRARRVLPVEIMLAKPDYNQALNYKDKGRGYKGPDPNVFTIPEGDGMPVEDRKKKAFPGPGAYGIQGKFDLTTNWGERPPAYTLSSAG